MADAMLNEASLAYAESFQPETELITGARERGHELGCAPIGAGRRRCVARARRGHTCQRGGRGRDRRRACPGCTCSTGMAADGQLVSDRRREREPAGGASEAFTEAGIASTRYRLINGSAADVLPRMRDDAYDLVFVDADKSAYAVYYEQAVRMLRPGGVVAFDNVLWHDRVADPAHRDTETVALRELARTVRDDDRLVSVLLASGDGLLVAAKR